jgi:hypothetical protein
MKAHEKLGDFNGRGPAASAFRKRLSGRAVAPSLA